MTFLDTGVLVGAVLQHHPEHEACREALEGLQRPFTDAHALAECFATLSAFMEMRFHCDVVPLCQEDRRGRVGFVGALVNSSVKEPL